MITQLTIVHFFGIKAANEEKDHQANEKLSCYKSHFQGDLSFSAGVFVSGIVA